MRIAAAGYVPQWHATWDDLARKLDDWVAQAAGQGADLLVFPEYGGVEAALIGTPDHSLTAREWVTRMDAASEAWFALHRRLARTHGVHILAGSLTVMTATGPVNRAQLCTPDGTGCAQDKAIPTPYERNEMGVVGGTALRLCDTALGRIGILICYDSEFPQLARQMMAAGAEMILVPSCTEFPAGQTRVRQSCRARAIEGQCLVVQAPLMGAVPGCEIADQNTGRTGFFCPPDYGLPSDGILMQGDTDVPGWTICDVDPAAIAAPRHTGQVGNFADWTRQDRFAQPPDVVDLRK